MTMSDGKDEQTMSTDVDQLEEDISTEKSKDCEIHCSKESDCTSEKPEYADELDKDSVTCNANGSHKAEKQDPCSLTEAKTQYSDSEEEMISNKDSEDGSSSVSLNTTQSDKRFVTSTKLQDVLDNISTNDSPIQAVSELTDVQSNNVDWRPKTTKNGLEKKSEPEYSLENDIQLNSKELPRGNSGQSSPNRLNITHSQEQKKQDDQLASEFLYANEEPSLLEQTVGKLKVSKYNRTILTMANELQQQNVSRIPLPSSANPDFLNELLFRSQVNRGKRKSHTELCNESFVPKRSPPPMYRSRRGRPIVRRQMLPGFPQYAQNLVSLTSSGLISPVRDTHSGLDLSGKSSTGISYPVNAPFSKSEAYCIDRQRLRTILPKINVAAHTQPPVLANDPTSPQTSGTIPTGTDFQQISSTGDDEQYYYNGTKTIATSLYPQEQPLDLCTKNSCTNAPTSGVQDLPSLKVFDENEPLNLSKNRSPPEGNISSSLNKRSTAERLSGRWKTPIKNDLPGYRKVGETSSPLEGDTASETAANSPGLDNHRLSNTFMSPNMAYANRVIGQLSPTSQCIQERVPEGAIIISGGSPHYRLTQSMALQHNEPPTAERPYMCEDCGATFKRNKSLKQHHRVHTGERPFKCDECDKLFRYNSSLREHEKIHTGVKPFTCDVCPRRFAQPEKLKRHVRIHSGEKPFICENDQCNKRFTDSSQLKLHMRTHSNHKPFPCPYCPLRFKYSGDVKRHVRIHTGEKPYVCGYCKMRFTQSNTLKQHVRTHTGERPYHCHKCGMTFTQSGSLKYHLAHRHPPDLTAFFLSATQQNNLISS